MTIHAVNMNMQTSRTSEGYVLSGASGMLGEGLRRALGSQALPMLQLVRKAPADKTQLQWNPTSTPFVREPEALEGCLAAVHLSGASVAGHRWTAAYRRAIGASRVDSTRALATLLAGLRRPPLTLLVASAVGIYGDRGDELLDETSATGSGFLADLCRDWEAAARPAADAGIRVVHLRLGVVLGPGGGALAQMLPVFRLGLGGRLGSGRQWMSWISLTDAIAAMLFALETPALKGPVNLTAPQSVTNAEFTRTLAGKLRRPAFVPAPAFALRLAFGQMADETLLASARAVPGRLLAEGFRFTHPTVGEALGAALA